MSEIVKLIPRIFLGVVCLITSHAIFEIFHLCGWYPEQQLAAIVMISPQASFWILSTVIAIVLWTGLDYWIYRRPTSDAVKMSATVIAQGESLPQPIESPLQIEFGTGDKYERTECINETGIVRRLIYVSMFNESVDDISDCNIRLLLHRQGQRRATI